MKTALPEPVRPGVKTAEAEGTDSGQSLVRLVVDGIIEDVRCGRLVPGQRLIATDLAHEFNVSRAPVREALHVLEGEGVVTITPNRGARINRLSVSQLIDFMEMTETLLVLGVRRTATINHSKAQARELQEAFAEIERQGQQGSAVDFVESLYAYHHVVNRMSGNSFVTDMYQRRSFTFFNRLVSDLLPRHTWTTFIENYRRINQTVLANDSHAAVATFVAHIQWVLAVMRENESQLARDT